MLFKFHISFLQNHYLHFEFIFNKISKKSNNSFFRKNGNKIFYIGKNKTGTTFLEKALSNFGYKIGNQIADELLIHDYKNRNWQSIVNFCKTSEVFIDVPFSWPYTWMILHKEFPDAKFILTSRNAESWCDSYINSHIKLFSEGKKIPTKSDLQNPNYRYWNFAWEAHRIVSETTENKLFNIEILIKSYNRHNKNILDYFKNCKNFIEIDVSQPNSYKSLCDFLKKEPLYSRFPHINKTN